MKKIFVVLLSVFIVNFYNFYVYAEEINRKTVRIQTLKNNYSIVAAKLALDNAKQEYNSSFSSFLPCNEFNETF